MKILILPQRIFDANKIDLYDLDGTEVEIRNFPDDFNDAGNFDDYDIIITHYSPFYFHQTGYNTDLEDRFEKLMNRALRNGKVFCFTHCYERDDVNYLTHRVLNHLGINVHRSDRAQIDLKLKSNHFQKYLGNWGASKLFFSFNEKTKRESVTNINGSENSGTAISIKKERGKILFIPLQINLYDTNVDLSNAYNDLIEALKNYIPSIENVLPNWAEEAYFVEENELINQIRKIENKLVNLKNQKETYNEIKKLLFLKEYELETGIIDFLRLKMKLNIARDEKFKEDFWILSDVGEKLSIGEIKSYMGASKDGAVYSILKHRDDYDLTEDFPAILIINQFINSSTWEEKNKPVQKKHYEFASQKNVLICRVEDLINIWHSTQIDDNESNKLLETLVTTKGWLEVNKNGEKIVHKNK